MLVASGFVKYHERADLQTVIQANVTSLNEFKPANLYQKEDRLRFGCDMFNPSDSQVSIHAIWRKEGQTFQKGQRAQWNSSVFSSGFSLGNTMSLDADTVNIIGTWCELSFSSIIRENKQNLDSKECLRFTERNAPRVFALVQFQALKELSVDNTYAAFGASKQNAVMEFEDNKSCFTVTFGKAALRACLGSKDVFVEDKKIVMKDPILMDENGFVQVPSEFYEIMASLK